MIRAMYTAATGMQAQQLNMDVIANNLANVNTHGFKKSSAEFQDLLYQTLVEPGAATSTTTKNPTGIQVGLGVKPVAVQKMFGQGDLASTGGQLDLAIEGDGFFKVVLPDGNSAYTRAGAFKQNSDGQLVTADGYQLDPTITIPGDAQAIIVSEDGQVSVKTPGTATPSVVGTLTAARFPNNTGLRAMGRNLFEETDSSGAAVTGSFSSAGYGRISQGFLETSNVSVVEEMVRMITGQRSYEANTKVITTADEMDSQAANIKR